MELVDERDVVNDGKVGEQRYIRRYDPDIDALAKPLQTALQGCFVYKELSSNLNADVSTSTKMIDMKTPIIPRSTETGIAVS